MLVKFHRYYYLVGCCIGEEFGDSLEFDLSDEFTISVCVDSGYPTYGGTLDGKNIIQIKTTQNIETENMYIEYFEHAKTKHKASYFASNSNDLRERGFTQLIMLDLMKPRDKEKEVIESIADSIMWRMNSHHCYILPLTQDHFSMPDDKEEFYLPFSRNINVRYTPLDWCGESTHKIFSIYQPGEPLTKELIHEALCFLKTGMSRGVHLFLQARHLRSTSILAATVMMVASLETAVKEAISQKSPDTEWIWENVPSPPLVKIIRNYLPAIGIMSSERASQYYKHIQSMVEIRNKIVHGASKYNKNTSVEEESNRTYSKSSIIASSFLYAVDYYLRGIGWAKDYVDPNVKINSSNQYLEIRKSSKKDIANTKEFLSYEKDSPSDDNEK